MRRKTLATLVALLMITGGMQLAQASAPSSTSGAAVYADDDPRIVGGTEVTPPGKYPFLVALISSSATNHWFGQFCGGALISATWVLTAAHCLDGGTLPADVDVIAGGHDLWLNEGQRMDVKAIHLHPDWTGDSSLGDDVALMELTAPVATLTAKDFTPAAIPMATTAWSSEYEPGDTATVIGWGNTEDPDPFFPDRPHEVDVPIISDTDCDNAYFGITTFPKMICAGDLTNGGIDSCQGDSGGPFFVPNPDGGWLHVGIVSWGVGCADAGDPGVYARTATYTSWIEMVSGVAPADDPGPAGPDCAGVPATKVGTPGADTIHGTEGDDVIVALGGNDTIFGNGGNDLICAGTGFDSVWGGDGNDRIFGQPGDDLLNGQNGNDRIFGGPGNDNIIGGNHLDTLVGSLGDDDIHGGNGNDEVFGLGGNDVLFGDFGDDTLSGHDGNDTIYGGSGSDLLLGGTGDDELRGQTQGDDLWGGPGIDLLIGGPGPDLCRQGEPSLQCEI